MQRAVRDARNLLDRALKEDVQAETCEQEARLTRSSAQADAQGQHSTPPAVKSVLKRIRDDPEVHPSKKSLTWKDVNSYLYGTQRKFHLQTGPNGGWSAEASEWVDQYLLKKKVGWKPPQEPASSASVQSAAKLVEDTSAKKKVGWKPPQDRDREYIYLPLSWPTSFLRFFFVVFRSFCRWQ